MSHILKNDDNHIFSASKNDIRPPSRTKKRDGTMMHHEMQPGMMQQKDMIVMEMWEALTDDQKKTLMKRMIDSKILMKEGMIKHFQFKIETMKMVKKMLDEC